MDGDTALEAAIRVINYANSLNFFDKGKNIEVYAAAAYYMTLRFMKVQFYVISATLLAYRLQRNDERQPVQAGQMFLETVEILGFPEPIATYRPQHLHLEIL